MLKTFELPAFIIKNTNYSLIEEVQNHIFELEIQMWAHKMITLFEDNPHVESFSIQGIPVSDDEGNFVMDFSIYNLNLVENCKEKYDDILTQLCSTLCELKENNNEELVEEICDTIIDRSNLEYVVSDAIGKERFKTWNEARLASEEKEQLEKIVPEQNKTKSNLKV